MRRRPDFRCGICHTAKKEPRLQGVRARSPRPMAHLDPSRGARCTETSYADHAFPFEDQRYFKIDAQRRLPTGLRERLCFCENLPPAPGSQVCAMEWRRLRSVLLRPEPHPVQNRCPGACGLPLSPSGASCGGPPSCDCLAETHQWGDQFLFDRLKCGAADRRRYRSICNHYASVSVESAWLATAAPRKHCPYKSPPRLAFQGWRRFCKEAPVNEQSNTHYRACNAAIMSKEAEALDWSKFTHVFLRGLPSSDCREPPSNDPCIVQGA